MMMKLFLSSLVFLPKLISAQLTVDILHVNDHHSHLAEESFNLDVADYEDLIISDDDGVEEVTVTYGGFPRLISYMSTVQAETTADAVLKLHAGDAVTGTLYYALFRGAADAELMNFACFDAFTLGNHEFDDGDANLAEFIGFVSKTEQHRTNTKQYTTACRGLFVHWNRACPIGWIRRPVATIPYAPLLSFFCVCRTIYTLFTFQFNSHSLFCYVCFDTLQHSSMMWRVRIVTVLRRPFCRPISCRVTIHPSKVWWHRIQS